MLDTLLTLYRPVKVSDSVGGFTRPALGTGRSIWGGVTLHLNEPVATVGAGVDVQPLDIIVTADGAQYEVVDIIGASEAPARTVTLRRLARPIHP